MFTGLIEERGRVSAVDERPTGRRLWFACARVLEDAAVGDSIAVSGCCLTAVAIEPGRFAVDAVPETLARTALGTWSVGEPVNLERSLRLDQRLGGHLVQGHVDGVGDVVRVMPEGEGRRMRFAAPAPLARFIAEKGSIAIDGVSLTVAAVEGAQFEVAYIPHTLAVTTAGDYGPGRRVHLEVDVIARYIQRMLESADANGSAA